jgi:glycosyltransferase involved in cell wall biosynthesis
MTHPVQYYSPWFRYINDNCPEIQLTVIYATVPTPEQQGVGFGVSFDWDTSPLEGYDFVQVRAPRPTDYLHSDRFLGLHVRGMGRAIKKSSPDAVLVVGWYSATLVRALVACRLNGYGAIYRGDTNLGGSRSRIRSAIWGAKTRAMLRFFDAFLTVGRRNHEYLRHFGVPESKIFFAPHCVDNELFRSAAASDKTSGRTYYRASLGLSADDFVVLFVGKVDSQKRPADVIAASAALGSGVTTLIVGTGPEEERCREDAARLGVRVILSGFVNQSGLGRIYGAADVCVLPSSSETWGLVVNEAMAAGTPCVVSEAVGCVPDLIRPGITGEVFEVGDVAACAAALTRIRNAISHGHDFTEACQRTVADYSFQAATEGLLQAVASVQRPDG